METIEELEKTLRRVAELRIRLCEPNWHIESIREFQREMNELLAPYEPCKHHWKATHQGQTYMDSKCAKCGETKRDSWD